MVLMIILINFEAVIINIILQQSDGAEHELATEVR